MFSVKILKMRIYQVKCQGRWGWNDAFHLKNLWFNNSDSRILVFKFWTMEHAGILLTPITDMNIGRSHVSIRTLRYSPHYNILFSRERLAVFQDGEYNNGKSILIMNTYIVRKNHNDITSRTSIFVLVAFPCLYVCLYVCITVYTNDFNWDLWEKAQNFQTKKSDKTFLDKYLEF